MICPYCDSRIGTLPDNRVCPHCGAPLGELKELSFPTPPLGKYKQTFGYMEIQERGVKFYENSWITQEINRLIPYDEIVEVAFKEAQDSSSGFLSVRGQQDRYRPIATTVWEAIKDATSVIFDKKDNERYNRVFEFLKHCAEIANKAREA